MGQVMSLKDRVKSSLPGPVNMTLLRNRVSADKIKMRSYWSKGGLNTMTCILGEGNVDTDTGQTCLDEEWSGGDKYRPLGAPRSWKKPRRNLP